MRLKRATQYALRVLVYLTVREETCPGWVSRRELAERLGIPQMFLARVCRRLVLLGLLEVQRGPGGGFRLAVGPDEVRVGSILQALEGPDVFQGCVLGFPACDDDQWCPLHPLWQALREHLTTTLQRWTLEELAREAARRGLNVPE